MIYRGDREKIKVPAIILFSDIVIILMLVFLWNNKILAYIISSLFALLIPMLYAAMIVKMEIDDKKLIIVRPLSKTVIKLYDIAFCMVNQLDDEKSIIYAFVRQKRRGIDCVKGIKQTIPFDEVVRKILDSNGKHDFDMNFNMAKKIPLSFVENGEDLKEEILKKVGEYQLNIVKK